MLRNNVELDLKTRFIEDGITQTEIAEKVGVSLPYVNRITRGREQIVNKTFIKILDELGYDVELTYKRKTVGVRVQKNLKSKILSLIATVICLTIALSCFSLPVLATTGENEDNALMVGVPADRCPVFYQDADTGEIVGIGVDLMRAVAENAGYDVSFICVEEPTLKEALDNEAYDIVMPFGSAVPSASGKPSIVTDNLIQTPFTLVTEGNGDLPQLNELHVGMLHSLAAGAETVQQLYPGMEITLYETMPECVKALRAGEVALWILRRGMRSLIV